VRAAGVAFNNPSVLEMDRTLLESVRHDAKNAPGTGQEKAPEESSTGAFGL